MGSGDGLITSVRTNKVTDKETPTDARYTPVWKWHGKGLPKTGSDSKSKSSLNFETSSFIKTMVFLELPKALKKISSV